MHLGTRLLATPIEGSLSNAGNPFCSISPELSQSVVA